MDVESGSSRKEAISATIFPAGILIFETEKISADTY